LLCRVAVVRGRFFLDSYPDRARSRGRAVWLVLGRLRKIRRIRRIRRLGRLMVGMRIGMGMGRTVRRRSRSRSRR
jgi:hypothetical protein